MDFLWRHINPSGIIQCQEVIDLHKLDFYIYSFVIVSKEFFAYG